jgi:hypothetical protein
MCHTVKRVPFGPALLSHTAKAGLNLDPFYSSHDTTNFFTALYNISLCFPAVIYHC